MKKQLAITALAIATTIPGLLAQVENRALSFLPEGYVDCGVMPDLDNLTSYSIQFWLNPDKWTENASIISRGDDFSINLAKEGNLNLSVGETSLTISNSDLKAGEWNQVTVICDNGSTSAFVNGLSAGEGNLSPIPSSSEEFKLGGSYSGKIDEVRLWNEALDENMKTFDYFINNTLNKWCPMWDNLVVYYKMDQKDCPYLVDYKGIEDKLKTYDNHGIMSDGVSRIAANNDKMPYLVNAAYTENSRFFDRIIPRDQYLLSNEVIILGADCVGATGHVVARTPNNHASLEGSATQLSSFQGKEGVLSLDGNNGSRVKAPAATLPPSTYYTYESWIYLDEWTPGAYLMRKENDDKTKGLAMYLGDDANNPTIIARTNGKRISSKVLDFPLNEWVHVAVVSTNGNSKTLAFTFYINGKAYNGDRESSATDDSYNVLPEGNEDIPLYIGESLKGKLDETCIWNKVWAADGIVAHMNYIPLPALNRNVNVADMNNVGAYYRYDDESEPGFSYHSQDNWAKIMRSAYDGHHPAKISLSVRGHGSADNPGAVDEFNTIMNTPEKREIFATDLAEMSKYYDGVELDLEWVYNATGWSNYNNLSKAIIEKLPEGKTFRISTHNVTYQYPKGSEGIDNPGITGFTFQQYGPQKTHFSYDTGFTSKIKDFINYGYPADKILSSYSTTTSKGEKGSDIMGVRSILNNYTPSEANVDSYSNGIDTWYYMGPMQVYKRAKHTREQNLQGIFYWDMGNDYWEGTVAAPVMPKYNNAKYCSYGLNANTDTIINNLTINHYDNANIKKPEAQNSPKKIKVTPSPAIDEINLSFSTGETPEKVLVYSLSGALVSENRRVRRVNVSNLSSGIYMLTATDEKGNRYNTKFVKK